MKLFEDLPSTNGPITAENLNQIQDNLVVVSATEPTGDNREKVWIQKGKNLYNGTLTIGSINESGVEQVSTNSARSNNYFKVEPNKNYIVSYDSTNNATGLNVVTFYDENYTFISRLVGVGKNTFVIPENCKYLRLTFYNSSGIDISVLSNIQLEQGSTATEYEKHVESKIYVKNDNEVYNEYLLNADDFTDYKSSLVKDDTYVSSMAVNWCEVRNGIAYVSMNLTLVAGEMSTAAATLVSGLPTPKVNAEIQTHLYNSTENHSIRARITTAGLLRWWYNPTVTVKSNNALSVNITYPVANT